jgi:hypothetical protein
VAACRGPQVVRVDLLADDLESLAVDAHRAADAAERLGERDGRAAVQDPVGCIVRPSTGMRAERKSAPISTISMPRCAPIVSCWNFRTSSIVNCRNQILMADHPAFG